MTPETVNHIIAQLDALLDKERVALLEGNLDEVGKLADGKEALLDALQDAGIASGPDLSGLQGKLTRNQALLDGALSGIRKVAARLAALRRVRRSLDTYDEKGERKTLPAEQEHKLEKRA